MMEDLRIQITILNNHVHDAFIFVSSMACKTDSIDFRWVQQTNKWANKNLYPLTYAKGDDIFMTEGCYFESNFLVLSSDFHVKLFQKAHQWSQPMFILM